MFGSQAHFRQEREKLLLPLPLQLRLFACLIIDSRPTTDSSFRYSVPLVPVLVPALFALALELALAAGLSLG
jgi:hypothetical protein